MKAKKYPLSVTRFRGAVLCLGVVAIRQSDLSLVLVVSGAILKLVNLTGDYDLTTQICSGTPWMVNDENMLEFLTQYRNTSVTGAGKMKNISDARILSLSFIFLFNLDHNVSCTHHLEYNDHVEVLDSINTQQYWTPLFADSAAWCFRLNHELKSSQSLVWNTKTAMCLCLEDRLDDNQGEVKDMVADLLLSLTSKLQHWVKDCVLESTFIHQHLMPFMTNIFENEQELHRKLGEAYVSRYGDDLDNGSAALMANYTVLHRTSFGQEFDLLVVEVKPPGKTSSGQLQSDWVKIGKEMKRMVDCLVNTGIDNILVGGTLVEGFSCSTYMMDLKHDGVCRMTQLSHFYLLRGPSDIALVPEIIEYILQLKAILLQTVASINQRYMKGISNNSNSNSNSNSSILSPISRKRKACGTPKRIK
ncbi:unnamed protein product [Absidia cylindrospora]